MSPSRLASISPPESGLRVACIETISDLAISTSSSQLSAPTDAAACAVNRGPQASTFISNALAILLT